MDYNEFAEKIKVKYPQYKNIDNQELANRMIAKYPEYKEQVTFEIANKKSGIDLTPSGISKTIAAGIVSPIEAIKTKKPLPEAFLNVRNEFQTNPVYKHPVRDVAMDTTAMLYLPAAKAFQGSNALARFGNYGLTGAYQGGLIGGAEALKRDANLGNVAKGSATGAMTGGLIGGGLPIVGNIAEKAIKLLPMAGGFASRTLGRIKPETLAQAVKPNSKALDLTEAQAQNLLMNTTERVQNTYDDLLRQRGQEVGDAIKNLRQGEFEPIKVADVQDDIISTFNQYQGDKINPARNMTGNLEDELLSLAESGGVVDIPAEQLKLINKYNPAPNEYSTWIRNKSDIKTYKEALDDSDWAEYVKQGFNPDYTGDMVKDALKNNKITVHSSYPIDNGVFVTPSMDEALSYAGNGKVYSKEIPLEDVAWIDPTQGQYAPIRNANETISPIDLQNMKTQIGKMVNWSDEVSKQYKNPILEQVYGKWSNRLNELSPELAQANARYAQLRNFQKNEGLKRILKSGDTVDTASSALRNYNNTVTKGNTSRNIQDLENLFVKEGKQSFLNDINDVNAAMDLLNARGTGDSWLANVATQATRPVLKLARTINRSSLPEIYKRLGKKIPKTLVPVLYGTPTLYGGVEYNEY